MQVGIVLDVIPRYAQMYSWQSDVHKNVMLQI